MEENEEEEYKLFLQPGNKMMYDLSRFRIPFSAIPETKWKIRIKNDKKKSGTDMFVLILIVTGLKLTKIDTEDDASFWNKLPEPTPRQDIQFWFRDYIPPNITVFKENENKYFTYYFGCLLQRNSIERDWNYIFKIDKDKDKIYPQYTLAAVATTLPEIRLNFGICSIKINGATKILLIGGSKWRRKIESYKDAEASLFSNWALFDIASETFDSKFNVKMATPKDWVTAVNWNDKFVYVFFGRKARKKQPKEITQPLPKFEYSTTIERWTISDTDHNDTMQWLNISMEESIQKVLKPLIIQVTDSKFLIIGGIKGNQAPVNQLWEINIPEKAFEGKDGLFMNYLNEKEEEKWDHEDSIREQLNKAPLSFPSCNVLKSKIFPDDEHYLYSSIGLNISGRPWVIQINTKEMEVTKYPILN
jgi:hypothetical protein